MQPDSINRHSLDGCKYFRSIQPYLFYVGQSLTADVLTANDVKQRFTNAQASSRGTMQRDKRVRPVLLNLLSS